MNYSEETIVNRPELDDEKTQVDNTTASEQPAADAEQPAKKKADMVKNIGLGTAAAVAGGVIGLLFTSGTIPTPEETDNTNEGASSDGLTTPVVTDGTLAIAHGVSDDMSFGEAFAAAHEEVGPGGVFEWHGELYGTYTAQEWNSLSAAEKEDYNSHLRVVRTPHYEANVTHHTSAFSAPHEDYAQHEEQHAEHHEDVAQHTGHSDDEFTDDNDEGHVVQTTVVEDESGVEVLGVEHVTMDDGSEVALGGAVIDGTVVAVMDVDMDGEADLLAADFNENGHFDDDEWHDVRDEHFAMSDFETEQGHSYDTTDDGIDYLADV